MSDSLPMKQTEFNLLPKAVADVLGQRYYVRDPFSKKETLSKSRTLLINETLLKTRTLLKAKANTCIVCAIDLIQYANYVISITLGLR